MKLRILALAVSLTTGLANAANLAQNIDKSGMWLGATAGMGITDNSETKISKNKVLSPRLEIGYDFSQYFGLYGSYNYMHNLNDNNLHIGTLGMKSNIYFTDNLSMYGKLGATYILADGSVFKTDNFSGTAGIGLEYQITHAITTKIGYDHYYGLETTNGKDIKLGQVYWGMTYKFGQPETPLIIQKKIEVPIEVVKEVTTTQISRSTYTLSFQTGQVDLNDYDRYNLDQIVTTMINNPKLKADIVGRTDSSGSKKTNLKISAERAQNVKQYLVSRGINAKRILSSGIANQHPLSDNRNLQLERSVQITLK
ncbi:OmpA family protein [Vibrio splendidus]|uniref:OmpA family protein n=1 Tax=Vibrio splendidus TaxID=29497 RepID=UPI00076A1AAC|nr:OmpA family protein [Vibrio splendidus]